MATTAGAQAPVMASKEIISSARLYGRPALAWAGSGGASGRVGVSVFYWQVYLEICLGNTLFVGDHRDQEHGGASNTRV
jgi:hypothetical protein